MSETTVNSSRSEALLEIRGLTKTYGKKEVLRGIDLTVPKNSVFGFVGKNGAGKTTTMKAILGLIRADAGEITVAGETVRFGETKTNRLIGYLPDVPEFYGFLTPREYLTLSGESLGIPRSELSPRVEDLLARVGLAEENRRIRGFSRGMKQRLGIAQALISRPMLLICDEPTSALDPIGRREILDLLSSVKNETTVLFSTHILSDVERISTDIAFLNNGRIELQGSVESLKALHAAEEFTVDVSGDPDAAAKLLSAFPPARLCDGGVLHFAGDDKLAAEVLRFIAEESITLRRFERLEPTLESLFMEVVAK